MPSHRFHALHSAAFATLVSLALLAGAAAPDARAADKDATQQDGFSAGLSVHRLDNAAKTGLPVYPGAVPAREKGEKGEKVDRDDSAGGSVGLWGGPFGFQLHAMKLQTRDAVAPVAAFYREALAREGTVVDCSQPQPEPPAGQRGKDKDSDNLLRCGSDKPVPGGQVFKIGTPKRVRMVSLEPAAGGTRIQLLRIELKSD